MNEKFCTNFLFKKKHNTLHKFFFICWKIRGLFPWRKFWVSHLMGIDACQISGVSFLCLQSKLNKIENLAMLWKTEEQILLRHINLKKIKFQVMVFFSSKFWTGNGFELFAFGSLEAFSMISCWWPLTTIFMRLKAFLNSWWAPWLVSELKIAQKQRKPPRNVVNTIVTMYTGSFLIGNQPF